jgi:tetratricopeptide (TPR) repeat protein
MQTVGEPTTADVTTDPAFAEIADAYAKGDLVIFAGAGVPLAAGIASRAEIARRLVDAARRAGGSSEAVAEIELLIEQQQIGRALGAARRVLGGPEFCKVLEQKLEDRDTPVPAIARAIAALAPRARALLTTNLDHFLERALHGKWPPLFRATPNVGQRRGVIVKLHGTLYDTSTWVVTRHDQERAMFADPHLQSAFTSIFQARTLLFVGYDLDDDDDFEPIFGRVRALAGDQPPRHFALVPAKPVKPYRRSELGRAGLRLVPCEHDQVEHFLRTLAATAPPLGGEGEEEEAIAPDSARQPPLCPFPGLELFDEDLAPYFFGRKTEADDAVQQLGDTGAGYKRWLQIEGPSGAGKSSLARAGIVPEIRRGSIHGAPESWRVAVLRPGADPLRSLAHAVYLSLKERLPERVTLESVLSMLGGSEKGFGLFLREHVPADHGFLLLVDQLEEAFTLAGDDRTPVRRFDAALADALRDKGGPLFLVTTIRSDFAARIGELSELETLLNASSRYHLKPISAPGLRAAVEEPARLAGIVWDPGLVERVLDDASASEGGLPLVAHVLKSLWAERRGQRLVHDAYKALGGVGGALTKSADGIVDGLGQGGRERARKMLLRLVKIGRGAGDTRQTVSREDVIKAGGGGREAEEALARLSGGRDPDRPEAAAEAPARLVVVGGDEGHARVDLVHDALLKQWETLRGWIQESRKALERRDDLESAAQSWEAAGKPEDGLPGGVQLAYLRGAEAPGERGREYLEKAQAKERRKTRRDRLVRAGLAAAAVAFAGLAAVAFWQRSVANQRLEDALELSDQVVFDIDHKLEHVAGAAELRKGLLKKTDELQSKLLAGAGDSLHALRSRAVNHNQLGDLALTYDNLALAREEYEAALMLAQQLVAKEPANVIYENDLSVVYTKLGDVAQAGGDLGGARAFFEKSLAQTNALAEADPKNADFQRELSIIYQRLGDVAKAGGDLGGARAFFEKALALRNALAEADPKNAELQRNLSISYGRLGAVAQAGGDLGGARAFFEKALAQTKALAEADPKNAELQRDLSASCSELGDVAQAGGDLGGASAFFEKALAQTKALAEADPKNAQLQRDLVVSYSKLGDVAQAGGDLGGARAFFEKALALTTALAEADPKNAQLQIDLAINHVNLLQIAIAAKDPTAVGAHHVAAKEVLNRLDQAGLGKGNATVLRLRDVLVTLEK